MIAINDGSTDDTLNILNEYAGMDERIRVYSKENGGYSTAINYGLERISGDYFLMMGSDDRLAENLFYDIINYSDGNQPDMIAFRTVNFVDGKQIGVDCISDFDTFAFLQDSTINEYTEKYPCHSEILFMRDTSKCFKTSLLGDLRYFGKCGIDMDGVFSVLFSHKCRSFMSVPIDGYYWILRSDSVSATTDISKLMDRLAVWTQYNQYVLCDNNYKITEQEKKYLAMGSMIGIALLSRITHLDRMTKKKIHTARKYSVQACKRFRINEFFPKGRFLFINMPNLWTAIFRMKTMLFRR